jgi:hypothetical protein
MTAFRVRQSSQQGLAPRSLLLSCLAVALAALLANQAQAESPGEGVSAEEAAEGFESLFDGKTLAGWHGSGWSVEDGAMVCHGGFLTYAGGELANFVLRFEVKLSPGANNGFNFRSDGSFWNELQVIDDTDPLNRDLKPYQTHGSLYGVAAAKRGALKGPGEWNTQEIVADGTTIVVTLNGTRILDVDLATLDLDHCLDGTAHPGLRQKSGVIGWLGHANAKEEPGDVWFRRLRLKRLP